MDDDNDNNKNNNTNKDEASSSTAVGEIVVIDYHDLVQFCSTTGPANVGVAMDEEKRRRMLLLLHQIEVAFGPNGLGILGVVNVPDLVQQRRTLLPLVAKLPTLRDLDTLVHPASMYSVGWSHGKEQLQAGQPDYSKGSFYANPLTDDLLSVLLSSKRSNQDNNHDNDNDDTNNTKRLSKIRRQAEEHPEFYAQNIWPELSLPELRLAFCTMGQTLVETGRLVAAVCDAYCVAKDDTILLNLQQAIAQSYNCKGRLLHYFAPNDNNNANANNNNNTSDNKKTEIFDGNVDDSSQQQQQQQQQQAPLWCAWHNDHGSLTGLVPGMYFDVDTGLEVPCPDSQAGLYVQPRCSNNNNSNSSSNNENNHSHNNATFPEPVRVRFPPGIDGNSCALYQIGETSQIQSGGLLQATPHAVKMAATTSSRITREAFAVFMEPEFDTILEIPVGKTIDDCQGQTTAPPVPKLQGRWKPGQTFGDFHLATISAFVVN